MSNDWTSEDLDRVLTKMVLEGTVELVMGDDGDWKYRLPRKEINPNGDAA